MIDENEEEYLNQTKRAIVNAGNLFYQYRACRRDYETIYDIENLQHKVVFAQSPLNMNDPFDSQIGFSAEKVYDECIEYLQDFLNLDPILRTILTYLLKYKMLGKLGELLKALSELKSYLILEQKRCYKQSMSLIDFVKTFKDKLYLKCPKLVKLIISKQNFGLICCLVASFNEQEITEDSINSLFSAENMIENLMTAIEEIRDNQYIPFLNEFLSKLTVSCFSVCGWSNPLMWAHYANSYAGICIEYDFSEINKFIGFINKVEYSGQRPTISLKDLGMDRLEKENETDDIRIIKNEPNMEQIMKYLLVKDTWWKYEQEWRIINVESQPYAKRFIEVPHIKSITFGIKIDPICKRLILDTCKNMGIECYDLVLSKHDFTISREKIDLENLPFNADIEFSYLNILIQDIDKCSEKLNKFSELINSLGEDSIDFIATVELLGNYIDFVSSMYYLKLWYNRFVCNTVIAENQFPDDFKQRIKMLDETMNENFEIVNGVKDTMSNMSDYLNNVPLIAKIKKQIENIVNLAGTYNSIDWQNIS